MLLRSSRMRLRGAEQGAWGRRPDTLEPWGGSRWSSFHRLLLLLSCPRIASAESEFTKCDHVSGVTMRSKAPGSTVARVGEAGLRGGVDGANGEDGTTHGLAGNGAQSNATLVSASDIGLSVRIGLGFGPGGGDGRAGRWAVCGCGGAGSDLGLRGCRTNALNGVTSDRHMEPRVWTRLYPVWPVVL